VEAIIVSYNTHDVLGEMLRSLFRNYPSPDVARFEVTVVDNGSTDGSAEMVATEFPAANLIRLEENLGFGHANNVAALRSTADFLLLMNSDVILRADIVSPLLAAVDEDPKAVLAGPRLIFPDGQVQDSAQCFPTVQFEFALVLSGTRLGRILRPVIDSEAIVQRVRERSLTERRVEDRRPQFVWATCWLIRTSIAQSLGLFRAEFPMYDEDLDFCQRAMRSGWSLRYVPCVELVHLGGASSSSTVKALRMASARRRYYRIHRGRVAAAVYRAGMVAVPLLVRLVAALPPVRRP
jgi:GT2 family glycosyltransferase